MNRCTPLEALVAIRDVAGNDSKLAAALDVTQPRVWRWINRAGRIPGEFVLEAVRLFGATAGVTATDLRPDLYPRDMLTDEYAGLRFIGLDRRASSAADRLALGEHYARAG